MIKAYVLSADDEFEKPVFGKKELNFEEDMEMYSKFLERKVSDILSLIRIYSLDQCVFVIYHAT